MKFKINNLKVSKEKIVVIAEAGVNHLLPQSQFD